MVATLFLVTGLGSSIIGRYGFLPLVMVISVSLVLLNFSDLHEQTYRLLQNYLGSRCLLAIMSVSLISLGGLQVIQDDQSGVAISSLKKIALLILIMPIFLQFANTKRSDAIFTLFGLSLFLDIFSIVAGINYWENKKYMGFLHSANMVALYYMFLMTLLYLNFYPGSKRFNLSEVGFFAFGALSFIPIFESGSESGIISTLLLFLCGGLVKFHNSLIESTLVHRSFFIFLIFLGVSLFLVDLDFWRLSDNFLVREVLFFSRIDELYGPIPGSGIDLTQNFMRPSHNSFYDLLFYHGLFSTILFFIYIQSSFEKVSDYIIFLSLISSSLFHDFLWFPLPMLFPLLIMARKERCVR